MAYTSLALVTETAIFNVSVLVLMLRLIFWAVSVLKLERWSSLSSLPHSWFTLFVVWEISNLDLHLLLELNNNVYFETWDIIWIMFIKGILEIDYRKFHSPGIQPNCRIYSGKYSRNAFQILHAWLLRTMTITKKITTIHIIYTSGWRCAYIHRKGVSQDLKMISMWYKLNCITILPCNNGKYCSAHCAVMPL